MPGKYMRGALIHLMEAFLLPIPNIILFQYNPETMTHTWTPPGGGAAGGAGGGAAGGGGGGAGRTACGGSGGGTGGNPLAASGFPGEAFSFTLSMNANDTIAEGNVVTAGIATVSGIYTRLAALEMLQYPVTRGNTGLAGGVSLAVTGFTAGAIGTAASGPQRTVPEMQVPAALFIWGPGRIVPVRVTTLTITEKQYDFILNPVHAEAQIGLRVLTPQELNALPGGLKEVAKAGYIYTHALRQALALANLANTTESVIGLFA